MRSGEQAGRQTGRQRDRQTGRVWEDRDRAGYPQPDEVSLGARASGGSVSDQTAPSWTGRLETRLEDLSQTLSPCRRGTCERQTMSGGGGVHENPPLQPRRPHCPEKKRQRLGMRLGTSIQATAATKPTLSHWRRRPRLTCSPSRWQAALRPLPGARIDRNRGQEEGQGRTSSSW